MGKELYRAQLGLIERIIQTVSRRQAFLAEDAEEFASYVHEKLIRDEYAVLRNFRAESSLKTFLHVTVTRLGLDFRNQKWGKWRPSAAARRMGGLAVTLETLVYRDGCAFAEAAQIMRTNLGLPISDDQLEDLAAALPPRARRRVEGEEALQSLASGQDVEQTLIAKELREELGRLGDRLKDAMSGLAPEDRLILRMHFEQGLTWTRIAAALSIPRRLLYSRKDAALKRLRKRLEEEGITRRQVADLFRDDLTTMG